MRRQSANTMRPAVAAVGLALTGLACTVGPRVVHQSAAQYNEVLQRTADEQLLLNLVRLKYRESPLFLEVSSLAAQFNVKRSLTVSGRALENVGPTQANILDLGGELTYEERPTVTFTPLQGAEFVERFMAPLSLDAVMLLANAGWSVDRVFRLTVQRVNGVDNAMSAAGPTPAAAPDYAAFARGTHALRALQQAGLLDLGYEVHPAPVAEPIATERVGAADVVGAAQHGWRFAPAQTPGALVLTSPGRRAVLRIAAEARDGADARAFYDAFRLTPGAAAYALTLGIGRVPEGGLGTDLYVSTRSLLGMLFYLSHGIEAPADHETRGYVTVTHEADGARFDWGRVTGDLLRVRATARRPAGAAVAVPYRGTWFSIPEDDLTSKSTFALLGQLFSLQAGRGGAGGAPVLTLPVGG